MYQLTEFCIDETANPKFLEMLLPLNNDILKKSNTSGKDGGDILLGI